MAAEYTVAIAGATGVVGLIGTGRTARVAFSEVVLVGIFSVTNRSSIDFTSWKVSLRNAPDS